MHALRIWFDYTTSRREVIVLVDSIIDVISIWNDTVALDRSLRMIALAANLPYYRPANCQPYIFWVQQQHIGSFGSGPVPLPLAGTDITGLDRAPWHRILRTIDARGWSDILYIEDEGRAEMRICSPSQISVEDREVVRVGVVTLDATPLTVERYLERMDDLYSSEITGLTVPENSVVANQGYEMND
ncbi:hypothetical protein AB5N19_00967 [Seiridium cardinale]